MRRILVIRFSALGDLVTLEPVLRACRSLFAGDRITFLTSSLGKELYENYFDEVITTRVPKKKRIAAAARVARELRESGPFDLVVDLQCGTFSHLVGLMTRKELAVYRATPPLKRLLGMKSPGSSPGQLFVDCGVPPGEVDAYFSATSHSEIRLQIPDAYVDAVREYLPGSGPRVAIAPGASPQWPTKQWGTGRFASLARSLADEGIEVLVVGGENEKPLAAEICDHCPQARDLTGRTSIRDLTALLSKTDVLVGNDSGPAHLAAAAGASTLSIFGPTDPRHSVAAHGYPGRHETFSPSHTRCAPCYRTECPYNMECMAETGEAAVFEATLKLLGRGERQTEIGR